MVRLAHRNRATNVQFLDATLSVVTLSFLDLFLTMDKVLRGSGTLGGLLALFLQCGQYLDAPNARAET